MGLGYSRTGSNGTGIQRDWEQSDWDTAGLGHCGTRTLRDSEQWDRDTAGPRNDGTGTQWG